MASRTKQEKSKPEGTVSRKKPSKDVNFQVGIRRVLAQVHPDQSIKGEALRQLDSIAVYLGKKIAHDAAVIVGTESKTINGRAVLLATRALFDGELAKHAHALAGKAVTHYEAAGDKGDSRSAKAHLQLSVSRAERLIREHGGCGYRVSATAGVVLAAALEYIIAEIIELAGNASRDSKKVRISIKHVQLAVQNDADLFRLLGKGVFSAGGVLLVGVPAPPRARKSPAKKAASPAKKASPKKKAASPKKGSAVQKMALRKSKAIAALQKEREGMSPSF
ncbi:histone H2B/H2A fusion protein [Lausannevirus]|uniref:Histone H2B/H2A fusion protein n=1 Tax=Lausannevirus TaxID=999883 RepID=F2WLW3_9VIRU|nr:histone H2B/H2A fusion protein [Lausannevirus]AEA07236.1 histone H2B/H2A fusion protein [Lausannevirus]